MGAETQPLVRGEPPFVPGDIVELKSGGAPMTVEQVDQRCGGDLWTIHVAWACRHALGEIPRDSFPSSCLRACKLTDDGYPIRYTVIDDNLPF